MEKKCSIKDVAKYAGVSTATVSRVINKTKYPVSEKNRKKVEDAVKKLGYQPNLVARSLKTEHNKVLGLIVRDMSDYYFNELATGVTEKAYELGYMAMVCNSSRHFEYELEFYDKLIQQNVEGIIIAGGGYKNINQRNKLYNKIKEAQKRNIQIVTTAPQGIDIPYIGVNEEEVGYTATKLLIEKGHENIAYIGGPENIITNEYRFRGYQRCLKDHKLEVPVILKNEEFGFKSGYNSMRKIYKLNKNITAVFSINDNNAAGATQYLNEINISIPEDIELIGVGDIMFAKHLIPSLSTISIPFYDIGSICVERIIDKKLKKDPVYLDFKYIDRNSTK